MDIWASGLSILGADDASNTATQTISGTSMSTPHVTGAIAQMLSCQGNLSSAQVEGFLYDGNARPVQQLDGRTVRVDDD